VLSQVSRSLETIPEKQVQSNLAATTSILAGLVLNRETIKKILRSEIMRESVIYQDILEEGREEGALTAKLNSIPRLLALGLSVEQIAQTLDLDIEQVPEVIEGQN
jgi:predicted transposase/invertase (TIGR01784 family)